MEIRKNVILAPYTTFKIGGPADFFCIIKDQFDALEGFEFAQSKKLKTLVLGGGSNLLISDEGFKGLVMKVENKGIEVLHQDGQSVMLKVASGEVWDEVVNFAVKSGWWGIENLSHIPGSTGAIAVQNVGAYGQEAQNTIESVTVFDRTTGQVLSLKNSDCGFSYRSSIFNTGEKGKYIIFFITFKLQKNGRPNLSYRDLKNKFSQAPSLREIRQAVTEIRDQKFPFPTAATNGNAGSFFKNSVLDNPTLGVLKRKMQSSFGAETLSLLEVKVFEENGLYKVPAAFLIEICGLKDLKEGGAVINRNQPLVIVNKTGSATAVDVISIALKVLNAVYEKTGIWLSVEPELIGFSQPGISAILNPQ